jgi:hypothetical protein
MMLLVVAFTLFPFAMQIVLCPGIHPPDCTDGFLAGMGWIDASDRPTPLTWRLYPATDPPYSPLHVLKFLQRSGVDHQETLLFVGFSAGVVGAIGAARWWQQQRGTVAALIALDGWGVPLVGDFAIHRVSPDRFTHWNWGWPSPDSFYADPGVEHLTLWRSPQTVQGWQINAQNEKIGARITVASFITDLVERYEQLQTIETERGV